MSSTIKEIKEFSTEIHQFVVKLANQLSPNSKSLAENDFRKILTSENTHLFIIQDNDSKILLGMLTLCIFRTTTSFLAWIEDVVIDESFRGSGYGKKIVEHAIGFSRDLGVTNVALTSSPSRVAANKLYQALGFEYYSTNMFKLKL